MDDWFSDVELDAPAVAAHEHVDAASVSWGECVEGVAFKVAVKHAGDVKVESSCKAFRAFFAPEWRGQIKSFLEFYDEVCLFFSVERWFKDVVFCLYGFCMNVLECLFHGFSWFEGEVAVYFPCFWSKSEVDACRLDLGSFCIVFWVVFNKKGWHAVICINVSFFHKCFELVAHENSVFVFNNAVF